MISIGRMMQVILSFTKLDRELSEIITAISTSTNLFVERRSLLGNSRINLSYFGARYLDHDLGIWTSKDPVFEFFNAYSYTGGNPVSLVDKDGIISLVGYSLAALSLPAANFGFKAAIAYRTEPILANPYTSSIGSYLGTIGRIQTIKTLAPVANFFLRNPEFTAAIVVGAIETFGPPPVSTPFGATFTFAKDTATELWNYYSQNVIDNIGVTNEAH